MSKGRGEGERERGPTSVVGVLVEDVLDRVEAFLELLVLVHAEALGKGECVGLWEPPVVTLGDWGAPDGLGLAPRGGS